MNIDMEISEFNNWSEYGHDPGDYPDGFDPDLYDL
jgi:hypothetical protein